MLYSLLHYCKLYYLTNGNNNFIIVYIHIYSYINYNPCVHIEANNYLYYIFNLTCYCIVSTHGYVVPVIG